MHTLRALTVSAVLAVIVFSGPDTSAGAPPTATSASAAADVWVWPSPEPHRVIQTFVSPPSLYASGHRGIDLAAQPGETVVAAHDGTVSFAGYVADRMVLSIMQADDMITTLEPVDALVVVGEHVRAGQVVGNVSTGGHCLPGCMHFGVRLHGQYVSPMLYLGHVPRAVLLPTAQPARVTRGALQARGWASP